MSRKRLLFLCQCLPYPPDGGVLIRSYHTLRLLAQEYDTTALCFFRTASRSTGAEVEASTDALREFGPTEAFPIPQEHSRRRAVWDHVRSVLSRRAYVRWTYESADFRRRLRTLLSQQRFDIIHIDSLDLVGYLPALLAYGAPVVVAHHNAESLLLARRAESERGARKAYIRHQAALMATEEARWCSRVALNAVVSDEDGEALRRLAPDGRFLTLPNGVDTTAFQPSEGKDKDGIVFVGGHTWYPNRDGMEYFADAILPLIRRHQPDVNVTWVGRAPDDVRRRFRDRGVEMTGYVEDIRPFVDQAACFVVPLRVGGGTRLKILDAWAMGKAVVSTPQGCEGLAVRPGENMLVEEDPDRFAEAVGHVLVDGDLRERLESGGRATAVDQYDWSIIGQRMVGAYEALTNNEGERA